MIPQRPHKPEATPAPEARAPLIAPLLLIWACAGFLALLLALQPSSAADPTPSAPSSLRDLPDTVNVHHQAQYCHLCHQTGPNGPIPSKLHFKNDYRAGCGCHYNTPGDLRHPTDVAVPEAMGPKLKDVFPLTDGKVTCVSCHSFEVLCAKENPGTSSLRGAPYPDHTSFCFRCHDEKQYEPLNPHIQLDESGKIVPDACLYCHTKKPEEGRATYSSVKLIGDSELLCQGCHNISSLHPAGKPHLVKPDLDYRYRMRQIENQYGIVLPLHEDGRITCVTCHNPHQEGVIPKARPGAKGAGEQLRHRLSGILCSECHFRPAATPNR